MEILYTNVTNRGPTIADNANVSILEHAQCAAPIKWSAGRVGCGALVNGQF